MHLNIENIEYYIIEYIEGNLNQADSNTLLDYIAENPEWEEVLSSYNQTILTLDHEDMNLVFDNKDALLKYESKQVVFAKRPFNWKSITAAASIILVVVSSYWFLNFNNTNIETANLVQTKPITTHNNSKVNQTANNPIIAQNTTNNSQQRLSKTAVVSQLINKPKSSDDNLPKATEMLPKLEYEARIATNTNRNLLIASNTEKGLEGNQAAKIIIRNEMEEGWLQYVDLPQLPTEYFNKESIIATYTNIKEKLKIIASDWEQTAVVLQLGDRSIFLKK